MIASSAGTRVLLNTSPVRPSRPVATTDRACTSSPTLVRSEITGASYDCWIGRAGGPCSVTHEHACERPRPATTSDRSGHVIRSDGPPLAWARDHRPALRHPDPPDGRD